MEQDAQDITLEIPPINASPQVISDPPNRLMKFSSLGVSNLSGHGCFLSARDPLSNLVEYCSE